MTTIVYRDGILAADTGATIGGSTFAHMTKIGRNDKGDLAGAAGNATYNAAFVRWFRSGEQGDPPKAETQGNYIDLGVIFRADGVIEVFEPSGSVPLRAPYYALDSGRPEALGALWMGATAEEAVAAAIALDSGTFGSIDVLRHQEH